MLGNNKMHRADVHKKTADVDNVDVVVDFVPIIFPPIAKFGFTPTNETCGACI